MMNVKTLGLVVITGSAVVGYGFDWPSSGTANIPAGGTAVITSGDVAKVAGLDAIILGNAESVVSADSLDSALTLKANVSGAGRLEFVSCANGVTLTGDNSSLTGNFFFSNTVVEVASRYGLGGSGTGTNVFAKGASGTFSFTGSGLTNDAPIKINSAGVKIPYNDAHAQMAHNADLLFDVKTLGGSITLQNFHMTSGRFKQVGTIGYFYLYTTGGYTSRFGAAVEVDVNLAYMSGSGRLQFDARPKAMSITQFSNAGMTIALGADNVFASTFSWSDQMGANDAGLDLMGCDQTINNIGGAWYTPSEGSATRYMINSDDRATLRFENTTGDRKMPYYFKGAASFDYAGTGTFRLINVTCDTTGGLTASSGTLTLEWNYGWNGTNVTVRSGATLDVNTPNAITSGKAHLVVESGGTLNANGNNLTVASATIGGVVLDKGDHYTADRIRTLCPGATYLGTGAITVLPDEGEVFEWPTEPGAIARIPMLQTVIVNSETLSKLASLGGVEVKSSANLVFEGLAEPFELQLPISGYGKVTVTNCDDFVIASNNTNFLGHFEFMDSGVTVTNRFALGCAASEPARIIKNTKGTFAFRGEGTTNDVALVISSHYGVFPSWADGTLVQNAGITVLEGATSTSFNPSNIHITAGTFLQKSRSQVFYLTQAKNSTLTVDKNAGVDFYNAHVSGNVGSYIYNTTNIAYTHYTHYNYAVDLKFGVKDAFGGKALSTELGQGGEGYGIDLQGYDQTFSKLSKAGVAVTRGMTVNQTVTSATPATLTVNGSDAIKYPLRLTGAASFTYAGSGTFTLVNRYSDTAGALTVGSGTLALDWDYGWYGTNIVVKGGTLKIAADAKSDVFNATSARATTVMTVEQGGSVVLETGIATRVGHLIVPGSAKELECGVYGGSEAGLDAGHTLSCFSGPGTISVERGPRKGLGIILR